MAQDNTKFLRRSLQLDGLASGLCGALLLAAAGPISTLLGLPGPGIARVVGVGLLIDAAALLWNGSRQRVSRGDLIAVVLNAAWVVGSVALIAVGSLTLIGNLAGRRGRCRCARVRAAGGRGTSPPAASVMNGVE